MCPHNDPGGPFESAFPGAHGKCVCQMCKHRAYDGLPHHEGPLRPSVPASSRHASCGLASYRGLSPQPPVGKTRRKQACLSAGTEPRSSHHWGGPSPLHRAAFGLRPSGAGVPPAAVASGAAVRSGFTRQGPENQPPGTCHGCKRRDAKRRRRTGSRSPLGRAYDDCPAGALPPERRLGRDGDPSLRCTPLRMTDWCGREGPRLVRSAG